MDSLFLGEQIEDVYHFGRVMGRPMKDPVICFEWERTERYEGGISAAARMASEFRPVDVVSDVRITKERWVDTGHMRKLFEVYGRPCRLQNAGFSLDYDTVVVVDYGHGMFTEELIDRLSYAPYLAVNVQTNAGNYGFNLAPKWGCDYLCVDETEARLATRNQSGPIEYSLDQLSEIADKVVITLGKEGAIGTGGIKVPAFTDKVVDTLGSGDAFFAVTALFAREMDMKELLRLGNAAGAAKAQIVGHRRTITKKDIESYL